jgi:hypothetical protein
VYDIYPFRHVYHDNTKIQEMHTVLCVFFSSFSSRGITPIHSWSNNHPVKSHGILMKSHPQQTTAPFPPTPLSGYCTLCNTIHQLHSGNARQHCLALMKQLEREQRLDFFTPIPPNPIYATKQLHSTAAGKMLGILEGIDRNGDIHLLYAFSGQFNGCWNIPGWAPPLFSEERWYKTNDSTEQQIKKMAALLDRREMSVPARQRIKNRRKNLSRQLMNRLHSLYLLRNFRGHTSTLTPFFSQKKGIPTGTGDCCAPKLLHHAIQKDIIPLGIAEFYWGGTNKSKTRHHGHFYPACADKCIPLMGFLLCGLEEKQRARGYIP